MATIDENYEGVARAIEDNSNETIVPLLVDPVTGRLLIAIAFEAHTAVLPESRIDDNYENVAQAVTDDACEDIKPLLVTPSDNYLLVDLVFE